MYRLAKDLAVIGVSLTEAVTKALRERLAKLRRERGSELAARLLAIGRGCAMYLKEPFRSVDHGEMFYDERGLPK